MTKPKINPIRDAIERLSWTFIYGALASPIVAIFGVEIWKAALTGGTIAVLNALKIVAGNKVNPSTGGALNISDVITSLKHGDGEGGAVTLIEVAALLVGICAVVWLVKYA